MAIDTSKITTAANDLGDGLAKGGTAAKTLGSEVVNAFKSLDTRIAALEAGGTPVPPQPNTKLDDAIKQNTKGQSEGRPLGVPHDYSWYPGKMDGSVGPPPDFTSHTGWGQVYPEEGQPVVAGDMQIRYLQAWLRKTDGTWVKSQDQTTNALGGAYFVSDFQGNAASPWNPTKLAENTLQLAAPKQGNNAHYWPNNRSQYAAGTINGAFTMCDLKVMNSNMHYVTNSGTDWWRSPDAPYKDDFSNNPAGGMGNWIRLTTSWRTSYHCSMSIEELKANPPPPLK